MLDARETRRPVHPARRRARLPDPGRRQRGALHDDRGLPAASSRRACASTIRRSAIRWPLAGQRDLRARSLLSGFRPGDARRAVPGGAGQCWCRMKASAHAARDPVVSRSPRRLTGRTPHVLADLLFVMTARDIKIKYKQSAMGLLWAILMPAIIVRSGHAHPGRNVQDVGHSAFAGQSRVDLGQSASLGIFRECHSVCDQQPDLEREPRHQDQLPANRLSRFGGRYLRFSTWCGHPPVWLPFCRGAVLRPGRVSWVPLHCSRCSCYSSAGLALRSRQQIFSTAM